MEGYSCIVNLYNAFALGQHAVHGHNACSVSLEGERNGVNFREDQSVRTRGGTFFHVAWKPVREHALTELEVLPECHH